MHTSCKNLTKYEMRTWYTSVAILSKYNPCLKSECFVQILLCLAALWYIFSKRGEDKKSLQNLIFIYWTFILLSKAFNNKQHFIFKYFNKKEKQLQRLVYTWLVSDRNIQNVLGSTCLKVLNPPFISVSVVITKHKNIIFCS